MAGYNESDTRAKLIDPALHTARWVEHVADSERLEHGEIRREQSAVRIDIVDGKPIKRGRGRVDYLLRAFVGDHEQPLTLAFVEAKKEALLPTHGLEQVKAYARRFAVKFVYSTNGHQFVEFDVHTGLTSDPRPMARFPSPAELRQRWFAATGLTAQSSALGPLLTAYHASGDRPRYYQDAAIRAVLERAAQAEAGHERPRALLSLATGAGKTSIAVGLLQRLSDGGQLRRALFLVDRDELREQAHGRFHNVFGADAKVVREAADGSNEARNARIHVANFADVLDKVHALRLAGTDTQHQFMLSQVYEGLLLKMGEKNSDGGQFYTPRELIRAMVKAVDPRVGETVCDPSCGTGGFLAEAAEHMRRQGGELSTEQLDVLKHRSFYGREKDDLAYPIALANLVLHGIDQPHLWHGNTLSRQALYEGLYENAPERFHVVLTNPPFGGKEGVEAQAQFPFKTRATQVLFMQVLLQSLLPGGRCGVVLDEGFLYRTNEDAFVRTKRKLLDENDLWSIVSLPGGAFTGAGAGVKTNLLFFTRGRKTERIWYYDLSHIKVGKKSPLTLNHFAEFFELLQLRGTEAAETDRSWTVDFTARRMAAHDEAAPHRRESETQRERALLLRERAKADRKAGEDLKADQLLAQAAEAERAARDASNKAQGIEDAIYDLKAVNPKEKIAGDLRTPAQLLDAIESKGREVDDALARLRTLIGA